MSKADKMLKAVGFEYVETVNGIIKYFRKKDWGIIYFDAVEISWYVDDLHPMFVDEHLAIHEKLKELGWLDEEA